MSEHARAALVLLAGAGVLLALGVFLGHLGQGSRPQQPDEFTRTGDVTVYTRCNGPDGVYWTTGGAVAVAPNSNRCTDSGG